MAVPLLDLTRQYETIKDKIEPAIIEVARSGKYINGPYVQEFEKKAAEYLEVKHAIGVASGTQALVIALEAMDIGFGDEVITTPYSFFATSEIISRLGARPVFVDIEPGTMNIDPDKVLAAISDKTKAILPVHIFGHSADMDKIMAIAEKHNLYVLEDACQAIGTQYKGKKVSSIGHAGAFSFFPSKNLGAFGDGGLVTTNDDKLAEEMRVLKNHGGHHKYANIRLGYNSRLDAMQAKVLNVKLDYLDQWNQARFENAQFYNEVWKSVDIITPQTIEDYTTHTYHQYVIRVADGKRDKVFNTLKENNIGTAIYYKNPLHLLKAHEDLGYEPGALPITEQLCNEAVALPVFPELTKEERDEVVKTVLEAIK